MPTRPKAKYGVECPNCKERLFSWDVHDFHYCKCKDTFIDGGNEYLRYSYRAKPKRIKFSGKLDKKPKDI